MVAGMSRERRIAALETRKRYRRNINIPLIVAEIGETGDEAVARYVAANGPLDEVEDDQVNAVVMVPVAPKERQDV